MNIIQCELVTKDEYEKYNKPNMSNNESYIKYVKTDEVKRDKIYSRLYDVYLDDTTVKNIKDEITFTFSKNYKELILTFIGILLILMV